MAKQYLKLHFIILILGFTAILGKLVEANSLILVLFRTLIATVGIYIVILIRNRDLNIERKYIFKLVGVGFILGVHWLCFFGSAKLSTVSLSLVTFSTTSFFTALLEPIINKTKIKYQELFFGVLALVGMAIVFSFEFEYFQGIMVGLLGAFLAALFSILNGKYTYSFPALIISFYELFGAFIFISLLCVALLLTNLWELNVFNISSVDWSWIFVLALACTVYPYVEMINLYKIVSVFTANLSLNMEPIYGVVLAYFIFGETEKMSSGFYFGGAIVFLSVLVQGLLSFKTAKIRV